jgi:hypothetical protein
MGRIELVQWANAAEQPDGAGEHQADRRRTGADPGVAVVSFLVRASELNAMYERVRARYVCWSEPLTIDVGGTAVRAFVVEDPDGVPIEFFSLDGRDEATPSS